MIIIVLGEIPHLYQIVFAIVYISKKKLDVKEKIENIEKYFQESLGKSIIYERLEKLEISFLILSSILVIIYIIILNKIEEDLSSRILIFIEIAYQSIITGFEISFLWEIYYIYENKKSNWVVINLLTMVFCFLLFLIFSLAFYIIKIFFRYENVEITFIINFKGMEINDLKIDDNFRKKSPAEKKRCILNKTQEMTVKYSEKERYFEIIQSKINEYRKENKLDILKYIKKLPKFIIKGNLLIKFTLNNIIKIEYKKYLFNYPSGEFLAQLNAKNKNILNILSLVYLNSIKIVIKDKIEYLLVYDDRNDNNYMNISVYSDNSISEREDLNNQNKFKAELKKNKIIKYI